MIYAVRARPWAPLARWRLQETALLRETPSPKTFPLSDLRAARIVRTDGRRAPDALILRLSFRHGPVEITSLSFQERFKPVDQSLELSAFARTLLARAAALSPSARYETGKAIVPGLFAGAAVLLGAGIVLILLATITAGEYGLGLEFAARLSFVLMLMLAAWPWLAGLGVRRFDPAAIPPELLT